MFSGVLILNPSKLDSDHVFIGGKMWAHWLTLCQPFYYYDIEKSFSVRPEKRWRGVFWYAYKRINGKLHNLYIGAAEDVTYKRLREIADQFEQLAAPDG